MITYLLCLIEQALVSGLNIGLNIWLIRAGGSDLYGIYAFWLNVALLAGSVQYGLTISHLMALPLGPGTAPSRLAAERALLAASLALIGLAALLVAGVIGIEAGRSGTLLGGAVLLVPAYLAYQYARALAFSRGAVVAATCTTGAVVVVMVAGLALDAVLTGGANADHVLLISGAAYALAGGVATWRLAAGLGPILRHLRQYLPYARISRWSLLGIVCFELMNRVPNFATTAWFGAAGLGRLSATQLPARVPILLVAGLQPALRNELAALRDRNEWRRFNTHTLRAAVAALAVNLVWAVPVGLGWPFVARLLFHGRFVDDLDLGLLWIASQAIGSLIVVAGTPYQVCGAFRMVGLADLAGAAATVAGLLILMPPFGLAGTIEAMIAGQVCYLAAVLIQWAKLRPTFPAIVEAALA